MAQMLPPVEHPAPSVLLGVDLGSQHLRLGTIDQSGQVLTFRRDPYTPAAQTSARPLLEQILTAIRQMLDEQTAGAAVAAIGVAFPGPVAGQGTHVGALPHLPSLAELDLRQEFARAFQAPVHFDNNAMAAAYAEMTLGAARGVRDWLYLHLGANVSAGLVMGGQLQRGKSGLAGAIGQMTTDPERNGDAVPLETIVSAENVVRRTRERLKRDNTSSLSRLGAMGGFTYDDIIDAAHGGDDLAKIMLQRTGSFIGMVIADVISLLNLELVAVGGAPGGRAHLVAAIAEQAQQRVATAALADCRIIAAELGAEAGVIGAALLAAHTALRP